MALSEIPFLAEYPPVSDSFERRLDQRRAERLRCWCQTDERDFYVRCLDLGPDGLFLQTLADLAPGTCLDVRIGLPTGDFSAQAEVVWQRAFSDDGPPPGLGLQFMALEEQSADILSRYLSCSSC